MEVLSEQDAAAYRQEVIADMAAGKEPVEPTIKAEPEEPEEPPARTAAPTDEHDPWAGTDPALKTMFDTMSGRVQKLDDAEARLKQAESRIGGLTNQLAAEKEKTVVPTAAELEAAGASNEKWDDLKNDFPEWAEAIDGRLALFTKNIAGGGMDREAYKADLDELKKSMKQENAGEVQLALLNYVHSDWQKTKDSADYKAWLINQSDDVVKKTKSSQAVDAIDVLDSFAADQRESASVEDIAEHRQRRLENSINLKGRQATAPKAESDMTDAEYRAEYAKEVFGK